MTDSEYPMIHMWCGKSVDSLSDGELRVAITFMMNSRFYQNDKVGILLDEAERRGLKATPQHDMIARPIIRLTTRALVVASKAITWLTQAMNRATKRLEA